MLRNHGPKLCTWAAPLVGLAVLVVSLSLTREAFPQSRRANLLTGQALAQVRIRPGAEDVRLMSAAFVLVDFARKNGSAESLMAAARILSSIGTTALGARPVMLKAVGALQDAVEKPSSAAKTCDPQNLLTEAETMSAEDPNLQASIRRAGHKMSVRRNSVGGPQYAVHTVPAATTQVYSIEFRGAEYARIAIKGDGDTELDLYVYDEDGNLVTCDSGPPDTCYAEWVPEHTGKFTVHVVNRGTADNQYEIVTN